MGSLKGGNESVETLFFGDPSRPRLELVQESRSIQEILAEVWRLVGGGGEEVKRFPSLRKIGFWSLCAKDAGDTKMEEACRAAGILRGIGLLLVDRSGEEWAREA